MGEPVNHELTLPCPCGSVLTALDEDGIVDAAREHLRDAHPGREYSREEILFLTI